MFFAGSCSGCIPCSKQVSFGPVDLQQSCWPFRDRELSGQACCQCTSKLNVSSQNYRYLDLLGVLCVCEGVALPENQTYICERWLVDDTVRSLKDALYVRAHQVVEFAEHHTGRQGHADFGLWIRNVSSKAAMDPCHPSCAKAQRCGVLGCLSVCKQRVKGFCQKSIFVNTLTHTLPLVLSYDGSVLLCLFTSFVHPNRLYVAFRFAVLDFVQHCWARDQSVWNRCFTRIIILGSILVQVSRTHQSFHP